MPIGEPFGGIETTTTTAGDHNPTGVNVQCIHVVVHRISFTYQSRRHSPGGGTRRRGRSPGRRDRRHAVGVRPLPSRVCMCMCGHRQLGVTKNYAHPSGWHTDDRRMTTTNNLITHIHTLTSLKCRGFWMI